MLLSISDVDPARLTMALSADPEETSVALNPFARESIATNTPTVPAIPSTATMADVQRWRTLRRLYTTGIATSHPPQRVDHAQLHGSNCWKNSTRNPDQQRHSQTGKHRL